MSERDFEIGGRKFKLSKIDAFKQFHIVRRLGPVLGEIIPVAQKLHRMKVDTLTEEQKFDSIAGMIGPIMVGISALSDQDADKVLLGLCSAVEMQQMPTGNWARVASESGLMFQDIDLKMMMQIAGRAFIYNMEGFFSSHNQVSHGGV